MKKILAILLSVSLICCLFAACKGASNNTSTDEETFKKPESYASVVKVTINPEFNLYLDENGFVLAVEPLNDDAKTITITITEENKEISAFVKELVSETKEKGFLKDNAEIKVETEKAETLTAAVAEAVATIEETFKTEASTLGITVTVEVVEKQESTPSNAPSNNETPGNTATSTPDSSTTPTPTPNSNTGTTTTTPAPTQYSKNILIFTEFSETNPLDINTAVNCVVDGLNYDSKYCVSYDKESGMWFEYTIPAADFLTELRKTFVISDAFFQKIKEAGSYSLDGPDTCEYKNGAFYIKTYDGWGGEINDMFYFKKLIDDKNGNITIYYLYIHDDMQQHYIEVTYTYSGSASYEFVEDKQHFSAGEITSTNKTFIDSLKIKSIKRTESFPGNPNPQKQMDYFYNGTSYYFFWYESDPNHVECFGFGGEESITCGCLNGSDEKWDYNTATKAITCPCGKTVLTEVIGEINRYD